MRTMLPTSNVEIAITRLEHTTKFYTVWNIHNKDSGEAFVIKHFGKKRTKGNIAVKHLKFGRGRHAYVEKIVNSKKAEGYVESMAHHSAEGAFAVDLFNAEDFDSFTLQEQYKNDWNAFFLVEKSFEVGEAVAEAPTEAPDPDDYNSFIPAANPRSGNTKWGIF